MTRRKPLNKHEAAAIARAHGGPLCTAMITHEPPDGAPHKTVIHIQSIGDTVKVGSHPTSWRKAFEAAGVFGI